MKNMFEKYWIYIVILFLISITLFIALKDDDNKSSNKNNNSKSDMYDIDEEIYVIEEETKEENTEEKSESNNQNIDIRPNDKKEEATKKDKNELIKEENNVVKPNVTIPEKEKYTCPTGYELINDNCYKNYKAKIEYKCAKGTVAGAYCVIDESTMANATYTCPSDYKLEGTNCVKSVLVKTFNSADYEHLSATIQSGYYNNFLNFCSGSNMYRVDTVGINYCYEKKYTNPTITYDCNGKEGTLAGNGCIHHTYVEATEFTSCPDGGYLKDKYTCRVSIKATKK